MKSILEIAKETAESSARKDLNIGDYLIDDSKFRGQQKFKGEWIEFGSEKFPDWDAVLTYLNLI